MKVVKYIESLNIHERPLLGEDELRTYVMPMDSLAPVGDGALALEQTVETRVVPIHHLQWNKHGTREEAYIAYSKEVQDLLEMPFDAMSKQIDTLQESNSRLRSDLYVYREMTFWNRIKWAFSK